MVHGRYKDEEDDEPKVTAEPEKKKKEEKKKAEKPAAADEDAEFSSEFAKAFKGIFVSGSGGRGDYKMTREQQGKFFTAISYACAEDLVTLGAICNIMELKDFLHLGADELLVRIGSKLIERSDMIHHAIAKLIGYDLALLGAPKEKKETKK